jgi:YD repeat-containing protein
MQSSKSTILAIVTVLFLSVLLLPSSSTAVTWAPVPNTEFAEHYAEGLNGTVICVGNATVGDSEQSSFLSSAAPGHNRGTSHTHGSCGYGYAVQDDAWDCEDEQGCLYYHWVWPAAGYEDQVTQVPDPPKTTESTDESLGRPLPCDACAGNPVNVATGNKYELVTDLSLSPPGIPLAFSRYYNSKLAADGPLGYGWTHRFSLSLQVVTTTPYTRIKIQDVDGKALYFQPIMQTFSDGTHFYGESGVKDRLVQLTSGQYRLQRQEGNLDYYFDANGKLTQISDPNGNTLSLTYTAGLLTQVTNNFGKSLTIQYSGSRISSITDPKNQSIQYSYTGDDLVHVSYPDGRAVGYAYSNHLLTDKYDTNSAVIAHWDYNGNAQVTSHYRYVDGTVPQEAMSFIYGEENPDTHARESTLRRFTATDYTDTVYTTAIKDGVRVITDIEGCGSTCGGTDKSFDYDTNLNLTDVTFGSGGQDYTTHYTYDTPTNWWDHVGEIAQTTEAAGW